MQVNRKRYVERTIRCGKKNPAGKGTIRDWYLVKYASENYGYVSIGKLLFPKEDIGKKVRIKVEPYEQHR